MKKSIILILFLSSLFSCKTIQDSHQEPEHNFAVQRLFILNENEEVLMVKEEGNWYSPSFVYNQRQYINESLDSLANVFGIDISDIQLKGLFSYKYEYHSYSTLRLYYTAKYEGGDLKTPVGLEDVQWMPINDAIEKTPVFSMKKISEQLFNYPESVWGGSFMVFRIGEEHQSRMVENFYPL